MSTVHVVPRNDLIEHDSSEDCACGPTPEAVFRDDGSNGWVYTHHSLDGRERREGECRGWLGRLLGHRFATRRIIDSNEFVYGRGHVDTHITICVRCGLVPDGL